MKLKDIKIELSKLKHFEKINYKLEQYMTPAELAANVACLISDSIANKKVLDLCCGTGMLSAACLYFNPSLVVGIDICESALQIYKENIQDGVVVQCDIQDMKVQDDFFDVVIMNPPFGTKIQHQDIRALDKALEICKIVYSMHKRSTREFLLKRYPGAKVLAEMKYDLPRTYDFHKKKNKTIEVDFIVFHRTV